MIRSSGGRRFNEHRKSGPTLEWAGLPTLDSERQRRRQRARTWQIILIGLALFWAGVGALIARLAG